MGIDVIKYRVYDGELYSPQYTITIEVKAPPVPLVATADTFTITEDNFNIPEGVVFTHAILNDWGAGYTYDLEFTNNSNQDIHNWKICLVMETTISSSIWWAETEYSSSPFHSIIPVSYSTSVLKGESIHIGWNGSPGGLNGQGGTVSSLINNSGTCTFISKIKGTLQRSDNDATFEIVEAPVEGALNLNAATGEFTYETSNVHLYSMTFSYRIVKGGESSNVATITLALK